MTVVPYTYSFGAVIGDIDETTFDAFVTALESRTEDQPGAAVIGSLLLVTFDLEGTESVQEAAVRGFEVFGESANEANLDVGLKHFEVSVLEDEEEAEEEAILQAIRQGVQ